MKNPIRRVAVTPDLHTPEKDKRAWRTHLRIVKDFRPDIHVIIGDWGEFESVSQHPANKIKKPDLGSDYLIGQRDLDALEAVLPKDCERYFLEGNHEYRVTRWITNRSKELNGGVKTVREGLELDRRGWKWVPYGRLLPIGKCNFAHGLYNNKYHSEKHVSAFGDTVIYGDSHTFQAYTMTHGRKPHLGMSIGCLRKLDADWLNGRPNQWVHGMGVVYVFPDGNFIPYFIPIIDGRSVFNGKAY